MPLPATCNLDVCHEICEMIASGSSLRKAGEKLRVKPSTFLGWVKEDADLAEHYARAVDERGCYYGELVAEIALECLAGEHEPQAARVACDALKWTAARMAPKSFGDKQSVEITQKHTAEDLERFIEQQGLKRLSEAIPE